MFDSLAEAANQLGVTNLRPLQEGAQKRVYLGTLGSRDVVLKHVLVAGNKDPQALVRAQREVDLMRSIPHRHLVTVESSLLELGEPVEAVAWIEERLEGTDLRSLLGSPWDVQDIVRLGSDVSAGLGALHENNVVHRDLSPGNVFRCEDGDYKVIDPGFAKHSELATITIGGQPGTLGYVSPEHVNAHAGQPTAASDVFACANLMYVAATGRVPIPYTGDNVDYIRRLALADIEPLVTFRSDLPSDLVDVISRGLHPHPARRFRNGNRMQQAIMELGR